MIQDKIFFDEKDPTGLSYNTPFTFYGSYQGRLWSKSPSGSIQYYTQNSDLSVFATTGSNQFSGSQAITGSLTVTEGITGTVSSASYVEYTNVANKPALVSGSAQIAEFGYATTGSNGFNGSQSITGSLTVTGQVVAQTLNVQQVTSSVVYSSGSNVFGNSLSNTQQFTGSVGVTGSLTVTTNGTELQVTNTGVNLGNALTDSHIISGSLRVNPNGLFVSGSGNVGILTNTPATSLHVNGTALFSAPSLSGNTQAGIYIYDQNIISLNGGNSRPLVIQAEALIFFTGTSYSESMRITSAGNVGIGIDSPNAKLNILYDKNARFAGQVIFDSQAFNVSNIGGNIAFGGKWNSGGDLTEWASIGGVKSNTTSGDFAGDLVLYSRPNGGGMAERMRITSDGTVAINGSSTENSGGINKLSLGFADGAYGWIQTWSGRPLSLNSQGNNVLIGTAVDNGVGKLQVSGGSITVGGGIRFSSSGADANRWSVFWNGGTGDLIVVNNLSDIRLKKDFDYNIKGLETIKKLKPLKFTWKDGTSHSTSVSGKLRQYGFIAQETMEADNYLAWYNESHDTWGIEQYESFSAVIVKSIQELSAKVETLEAKIQTLEQQ